MWSTSAVWKQYKKMAVFHFFLVNSTLIYILFSLGLEEHQHRILKWPIRLGVPCKWGWGWRIKQGNQLGNYEVINRVRYFPQCLPQSAKLLFIFLNFWFKYFMLNKNNNKKELSLSHKLRFSNPNIFTNQCSRSYNFKLWILLDQII